MIPLTNRSLDGLWHRKAEPGWLGTGLPVHSVKINNVYAIRRVIGLHQWKNKEH